MFFDKRISYSEVSRCKECAENIPLLLSQFHMMTQLYYHCGWCETILDLYSKKEEIEK